MGYIPGYDSGPIKPKHVKAKHANGHGHGHGHGHGRGKGGSRKPEKPEKTENVEEFFEKVRVDVRRKMDQVIGGRQDEEKIRYALGGKLLRPCLTILVYGACSHDEDENGDGNGNGKEGYERALEAAVAAELTHSGSLVHDDILDQDEVRRGKPALYRALDPKQALLIGHRMINLALSTVLDHGYPVIKTFLSTWDKALAGEVEDVQISETAMEKFTALPVPSRKLYFDIILKKTAALFSASAKVGAQEAGANRETVGLFERWGERIGLIYQLCDDYVDLKKGKLEKLTLLPLVSLQQLEEGAKEALVGLVTDGRLSPVEGLMSLGIDASRFFTNEIRKALSETAGMVKKMPKSWYTPLLMEAPRHIANSMLKEIKIEV